jgi:hypothetical protein
MVALSASRSGLARDGVDQFHYIADAGCGFRQFSNSFVGLASLTDSRWRFWLNLVLGG